MGQISARVTSGPIRTGPYRAEPQLQESDNVSTEGNSIADGDACGCFFRLWGVKFIGLGEF